MRRWLDRRPVTAHVNLRPALERDARDWPITDCP